MRGNYTLHEVTRGNGKKLVLFAQMWDMFVVSTIYEDKKRHKGYG